MSWFTIWAIALGLAMDAFAVAVASGIAIGRVSPRQVFRLAFHFGLFQAMMPVIGWAAGLSVQRQIADYDHWIAFALLAFVGGKALRGAFGSEEEDGSAADPTKGASLVMLSIATSIDALAIGLSFAMLRMKVWYPSVIIGIVAASLTAFGMLMGSRLGERFGKRMEVAGGLVLIAIGVKIVIDHTMGG